MGYVSLYRKWRPQTFEEVVGQEHITTTLKNAIKKDRVSHAYLFAGPRGTGKTSVAKILAKALNCEKGPTPTPCNVCHICQAITNGSSIDVVEIDAASNRGIDEIRDLREKVRFVPTEAGMKVYIVDEVHMLTPEAFNALLKMLEEPPAHVVFVLATTEPRKVLSTILSRCQRFDFHRIATADLIGRLKKVATSEKISIDEPSLSLIARAAHGSMRDAISTIDQLAAFTDKKIKLDDVTALLGMVESDALFRMADLVHRKETAQALELVEEIADSGRDLAQFVKDLTEHFRRVFIVQHADEPERIVSTTADEFSRLEGQAKEFAPEWVIYVLTALSAVLSEMRYASDARLLLEVSLVKLARAEDTYSLEALAQRVAALEQEAGSRKLEAGSRKPEVESKKPEAESKRPEAKRQRPEARSDKPPASSLKPQASSIQPPASSAELEKLQRAWEVVLKKVREKKISTYALILECTPVAMKGGVVTLEFNNRSDFHRKEVDKGSNRSVVEEAFAEVLGHPVKVKCAATEEPKAAAPVDPKTEKPAAPAAGKDKDVVEALMESFGAKVVEEKEDA